MPADSKPLGFNCIICGRDYRSIQFIPKQRSRKIKRKRPLGRHEPDTLQIPKRSELTPVDYSLRNKIIAGYEEQLLDKATKDLAALRRAGWQFLPFSPPLSNSERIELETYVSQLRSRLEGRKLHKQQLQREDSQWNVIEDIADIETSTYKLMNKLRMWVTADAANSNEGEEGEGKAEINNNTNHDKIIKWNPITMIRKYRDIVDPFRHLDFHMDFYSKVLAKYGFIPTKILSEEDIKVLRKAFDIIDKYTRQFYDRNYQYTWYEWFWIVRYAQAITPGKASKMLLALDGTQQKGSGARISPKHIKDKVNPVLKFWQDYSHYTPYFFNFLKFLHSLIDRDPELKSEYNKILEGDHNDNDTTINKMLEEHSEALKQKLLKDNATDVNNNDNNDYFLGTNNDDFKPAKVGPERVRIHHSNKNYQKEMQEFKNRLRKEKPKKKISCTFSPSLLHMDIRIKLHKEGKVPIIQT